MLIAVIAAWTIASCGSGKAGDRTMSADADDARLATPGRAVRSPTGDYRLEVVTGEYSGDDGSGTYARIRILDADGATVLDSPKRFSTNFATDVLWDDSVDRAWVFSADVGTYRWDRADDGAWTMRALGPKGIADREPPPPALLADRHPEVFGPRGRAKARKVAAQQAGSTEGPATAPDDARLTR